MSDHTKNMTCAAIDKLPALLRISERTIDCLAADAIEYLRDALKAATAETTEWRKGYENAAKWRDYYRAKWLGPQAMPQPIAPESLEHMP